MDHTPAYAKLGEYVAALLGANPEWTSPADYLEEIAAKAHALGLDPISDQDDEDLAHWRTVADALGIAHDGEDEDEDDEDDEDSGDE
jgi:hypothetical protein